MPLCPHPIALRSGSFVCMLWMMEFDRPDEGAYGRVTDPERYRQVVAAARTLIERLVSTYDVDIVTTTGGFHVGGHHWGDEDSETIHLTPGEGAPLSFVVTDFPGVSIRFGEWEVRSFPACGCDACDETPESVVERMRELVEAVVDGSYQEELTRKWQRFSFRSEGGGEWGESRLERGEWKEYGEPGHRSWPEWPRLA